MRAAAFPGAAPMTLRGYGRLRSAGGRRQPATSAVVSTPGAVGPFGRLRDFSAPPPSRSRRSEEHTSELQSLMRISYAVFCLKTNTQYTTIQENHPTHLRELTLNHL